MNLARVQKQNDSSKNSQEVLCAQQQKGHIMQELNLAGNSLCTSKLTLLAA